MSRPAVGVHYGETTQQWRNSRPREHLALMGSERRAELNALRRLGWEPRHVTWITSSYGAPADLRMETPEWWLRTRRQQCVLGIWLCHAALDKAIYYQLLERWVWDVHLEGCSMRKVGEPRQARTLTEAALRETA